MLEVHFRPGKGGHLLLFCTERQQMHMRQLRNVNNERECSVKVRLQCSRFLLLYNDLWRLFVLLCTELVSRLFLMNIQLF